jgi:hypothetical protein
MFGKPDNMSGKPYIAAAVASKCNAATGARLDAAACWQTRPPFPGSTSHVDE